jgi:hypothetical protein
MANVAFFTASLLTILPVLLNTPLQIARKEDAYILLMPRIVAIFFSGRDRPV